MSEAVDSRGTEAEVRVARKHQREANMRDAWREVPGVLAEHPN